MCGLVMVYAYDRGAPPVRREELVAIRDAMTARGPDGAGLWLDARERVGLAHRRLSIVDLSDAAAQPMHSTDGTLTIVFNGEIYNYRELRRHLEAGGHTFRTASDTEVILVGYRAYGERIVERLRGMFAFGIWDASRGGVLLARDHFGIKPLYLHAQDGTLRVASQVRALLTGGAIEHRPEPAGQVGFLLWGSVPEPYTTIRDVRSLPAGHTMWVDERGLHAPRCYFDLVGELRAAEEVQPTTQAADVLATTLRDSVKHHLIADVPVGVFLSAGLDSSMLAAVAAEYVDGIQAVTLGFEEFAGTLADEVPIARETAMHYGCGHTVSRVAREDFDAELSVLFEAMDQPSIDGVNTYFVARATKRAGLKVALSGVGGDELLAGYPSYRQLPLLVSSLRYAARVPAVGRLWHRAITRLAGDRTSPKLAGLVEYGSTYGAAYLLRRGLFMPWELPSLLTPELAREGLDELRPVERLDTWLRPLRSARSRVTALEMGCYMRNVLLRDSDWAAMAHSIEIRTPFVDVDVFRALAPYIANDCSLAKTDLQHVPRRALPAAVVRRRKTGFATPVAQWLNTGTGRRSTRGLRAWALQVDALANSDRVGRVA